MNRRLALAAVVTLVAGLAACDEEKHASKHEKTEVEEKPDTPAVKPGTHGAEHASAHDEPAVAPPAQDPYYFKADEPTRAAVQPKFKACYDKGLKVAGKKDVSGSLHFLVQVAPTGQALQVNPLATTGLTDPIVKCIEAVALAGKFAVTSNAFNRWIKFDLEFPPQ